VEVPAGFDLDPEHLPVIAEKIAGAYQRGSGV
jgi:hypothetical protein